MKFIHNFQVFYKFVNFTIIDVDVIQSPEQYLSINFSDPLKKQQNFNGLVYIKNVVNPKFIVDGNVLKVYPENRVVGNVEVNVYQGIKNSDDFKLRNAFQKTISFDHGFLKIYKPYGQCKFYPSCSEYSYQATKKYGALRGIGLGLKRIVKCHPWSLGGIDIP